MTSTALLLSAPECSLNLLPPSTLAALDSLLPFLLFGRCGSTSSLRPLSQWAVSYLWMYPEVAWLPWEMNDLQPSFINVLLPLARLFSPELGHYKSAARLAQMAITATHSSTLLPQKPSKQMDWSSL